MRSLLATEVASCSRSFTKLPCKSLSGKHSSFATCSTSRQRCHAHGFRAKIHNDWQPSGPSIGQQRRHIGVRASTEAAECLQKGQDKFNAGDRMGALRHFDEALQKSPTLAQRQAAHFNATAVHASFGDVELAQITLRDGVNSGLDFERALKATEDPDLVKFQGPPQIVIQLRKFAEAVKRIKGAVAPAADRATGASSSAPKGGRSGSGRAFPLGGSGVLDRDMSSTLRTEMSGIDPSLGGIIRRVAALLVAALVLGGTLFYVGLKLTFPNYQ